MESVQDHFVSMLIDRLQALEESMDELRASNEQLMSELNGRSEALCLMPHSRYTEFSDGYAFDWELEDEPTMNERLPHDSRHRWEDEVPLDEKHWDAIVFPGRVTLNLYEIKDDFRTNDRVTLGRVGQPVTVRELVEGVQAAFGHINDMGTYDGMMLSRETRRYEMNLCIVP